MEEIRKARERLLKDSEPPKKKLKKEEKPLWVFTPGEIIDLMWYFVLFFSDRLSLFLLFSPYFVKLSFAIWFFFFFEMNL